MDYNDIGPHSALYNKFQTPLVTGRWHMTRLGRQGLNADRPDGPETGSTSNNDLSLVAAG